MVSMPSFASPCTSRMSINHWRPKMNAAAAIGKTTAPNGQQTVTTYGADKSASTRWFKVKSQIDTTNWKEDLSRVDGLGRNARSQSVDAVSGDVFTLTCYDTCGRPQKTSNLFRGFSSQDCDTANGTDDIYWTSNGLDAAGRPSTITTPDGAVVTTTYELATTGSEIGIAVTISDQAGKLRRSVTNALGQLRRVDESDPDPTRATPWYLPTRRECIFVTERRINARALTME
jgi:hypothetical protein